jgi:DNA-binding transcriptional LysR family regulator
VLCASPDYLARDGAPRQVTQLAQRRCLVTATSGIRSTWVFVQGRRRRTVDVQPCLVSDDLGLLHEATRSGAGLCALPGYLVASDLKAGTLVHVLPRERLPGFRAYALMPSARHRPRRVRALVDYLTARLRAT